MLIVDAQVHTWTKSTPERPWPQTSPEIPAPHKPEPFTNDDLLQEMNAAGVQAAILVTPLFEGCRNDLVLEAAQKYPDRFGVMGRIDILDPAIRAAIPHWLDQRGMLGLRLLFNRGEQREPLVDGRAEWLWHAAEKAGIPIMLLAKHTDLHYIDRIAEKHPGLKITIDHLGLTVGVDEEAFRDLDMLLVMAKRPNVSVKVSCLPHFSSDVYPYRNLFPYIRRVYDSFGPKRMFWGTDMSRLPCTYREAIEMYTKEITWLTQEDKEWIMGRGVCAWLNWKLPGA